MTISILDEIKGVGPTRKRALRRAFGSLARLKAASVDEIAAVKGIPRDVAQEVHDTLRAWELELADGGRGHEEQGA